MFNEFISFAAEMSLDLEEQHLIRAEAIGRAQEFREQFRRLQEENSQLKMRNNQLQDENTVLRRQLAGDRFVECDTSDKEQVGELRRQVTYFASLLLDVTKERNALRLQQAKQAGCL